jgi:sialidase-1
MAAGREGTPSEGIIYLLYESGEGAKMVRFNLAWLTNGRGWRDFINK